MPVHPAADLFPMLTEPELKALADDIKQNGLQTPIVTYQGQILDGRNRLEACTRAGVMPAFKEWKPRKDEDPVTFVIGANLLRRHLSTGQRAALAVELEGLLAEQAKERIAAGAKAGGLATAAKRAATLFSSRGADTDAPVASKKGAPVADPFAKPGLPSQDERKEAGRSRDMAAAAMKVSSGYVGDAKNLKKSSPETFERLRAGEVTLPQAQRIAFDEAAAQGLIERSQLRPGVKAKIAAPRRTIKPVKKFGKVQSSRIEVVCTITFGSSKVAADVMELLDNDPRVLKMEVQSDGYEIK
jgi:hypothetical protein